MRKKEEEICRADSGRARGLRVKKKVLLEECRDRFGESRTLQESSHLPPECSMTEISSTGIHRSRQIRPVRCALDRK